MEIIKTDKAPAAVGPYSQGTKAQGLIFVSGQLPVNMETGDLETDVKKAARASLENVLAIVEAGGSSLGDIVKVNVYVTNIDDFGQINEVYQDFFANYKPARALVEVKALPKGAVLEIEAIAEYK